jgi:uncharacterized protein (TIGR03435 family)
MRKVALGVCLAVGIGIALRGQTPEPAPQTSDYSFEVATLKQNKSGERGGGIRRLPGGRVTVTNMAARQLVAFAYGINGPFQLVGGPGWLADDKFDMTAKMEGNPDWGGPGTGKPDPITIAMRKLLTERFKLKLHTETRDLDAYALVMVKPGTPGPQLKPSPTDCKALLAQAQRGQLPPPQGPPSFDKPIPCSIMGRFGQILFDGFPMSQAATMMMNQAGRPVVDRTGLTGNWQFMMTFAQERPVGAPAPPNEQTLPDPNAPSFFTALQEQLGLKLESTKAPFDVTVIDAVDHPMDD